MKLTKRKGFNFFRSYYDVYNELPDKDKLKFIEALLDRQFLGIKPKGLTGLALFAYISQTNSIDSQVKGFEDKTGIILTPCEGSCEPPTHGDHIPPRQQVEGKEKGKEKDNMFDSFWNLYNKKTGKEKCEKKWSSISDEDKNKIITVVPEYVKSTPDINYRKNPLTYLNGKHWNDELSDTGTTGVKNRYKIQ